MLGTVTLLGITVNSGMVEIDDGATVVGIEIVGIPFGCVEILDTVESDLAGAVTAVLG